MAAGNAHFLCATRQPVHHRNRRTDVGLDPVDVERLEGSVLELLRKGLRNREIAASLGISEENVQTHVKNVLAKLEVQDRTAAIFVALRRGILHFG